MHMRTIQGHAGCQESELLSAICTGALSGALYRAPRGLRTAGVAGGIGAVAASALVYARNNFSKAL